MASSYEILFSETVPETVTPTIITNVEQITARALPSNIVYYVRLPDILQDPQNTADILDVWAGWLNQLATTPGVRAVVWVQDVDASDMVVDTLDITVASTSGKMQVTLTGVPTEETVSQWQARVRTTRDALDALEAE